MHGKRKLVVLLPVVVVVAAVLGIKLYRGRLSTDPNVIALSGNIEVTDLEASFKIAGRVQERLVQEGQQVAVGDVIARLDDTDLAQEAAIRQAEVDTASAALAELEAGAREQEVAAAEATVRRAQAELAQQQRDHQRKKQLHERNVISTQEYELAQLAYEVAVTKAREAQEQLALVQEGPRQERIQQARARLEQAKRAFEFTQIRLGYAILETPISGVILSEHIESGEYVVPGTPIVTVGALETVWLRGYINETDLGRVKLGQSATVTTDSYPDKTYEGRVAFIASEAEFTPKNVQTTEERVKLVYRVKIDIPNAEMELKPGMPADAKIVLDEGAG